MFALLFSRTPTTNLQSKKPNKKGTCSKVFSGTRLKWGSYSLGGICSELRALYIAQTWLRCFLGLAFFSSSAVLLEQHHGQKHSSSSGCCSSRYFFKAKGCAGSEPRDCTLSSYVDASNLEKPVFLKNLKVYGKLLGLEIVEDVLLVDASPEKNLLNDAHSVVHLSIWSSDDEDRFISMQLQPWLEGLFRSSEAHPPSGWSVTNIPEVRVSNQDSKKDRIIFIVPFDTGLQFR